MRLVSSIVNLPFQILRPEMGVPERRLARCNILSLLGDSKVLK